MAVALSAMTAACAPAVQSATVKVASEPVRAADDAVVVVIVQPESRLRSVGILDGRGQLVAQLDDRSHAVVHVKEGPTVLYAVRENDVASVDRVEGTLVPGRVYYAIVGERPGGVSFEVLSPRSPGGRWAHKDDYLRSTPRLALDGDKVGRVMNELGDPDAIVQAGEAAASKMTPAATASHTFQENDGY